MRPMGKIVALSLIIFAGVVYLIFLPSPQPTLAAGPWYVAPGGSNTNPCNSPAAPCATVNGVLNKAGFAAGDIIRVAGEAYYGTGNEIVLLNKNAILSGGWNNAFTIQSGYSTLDGQGLRRGLVVAEGITATVERFVIKNGASPDEYPGGGIFNKGILTLNRCQVINNEESGIASGYWRIDNGERRDATLVINNNFISENIGSGVYSTGWLTINNSAITKNVTDGFGGGILAYGQVTMNNSTVASNSALYGGGILLLNDISVSHATINSSTIAYNHATNYGGGINVGGGEALLKNTILTANTANVEGPNCFGQNYTPNLPYSIRSAGYNLVGNTANCNYISGTGDHVGVNPGLGELFGWSGSLQYIPLTPSSPAVNAGNPTGCTGSNGPITVDQRGVPRDARCDIGAYEYSVPGAPASVHMLSGSPQHAGPNKLFRLPLRAAIIDAVGSPVIGTSVNFSAPSSGPSGVFSDTGTTTTSAISDDRGITTAPGFTANSQVGHFTVTAGVSGVTNQAEFHLFTGPWYVAVGKSDQNDCYTPETACASVNGVLNKPDFIPDDQIWMASGIYTSTLNTLVTINKNVHISGGWDATFTSQSGWSALDGEGIHRVLTVSGSITTTLERLIIQNGSADRGGGIFMNTNSLTCNQCIIQGNYAESHGGGVFILQGALTLNSSAVVENRSGHSGGGILVNDSSVTLNNSTVSGNITGFHGGGIFTNGSLTSNSSTISGNQSLAGGTGGFIAWTATLYNTIVAGNINGLDCEAYSQIISRGYNLIGNTTGCDFTLRTGDIVNIDARLGPVFGPAIGQRYVPLQAGSPAINAGDPAGCSGSNGAITTDQRGVPRDARCDIGAYEYAPPGAPARIYPISGEGQVAPPGGAFSQPLRTGVLDAVGSPVPGVVVSFRAPHTGASAIFFDTGTNATQATSDGSGIATSAKMNANNVLGAYIVTATATGVAEPTNFRLQNGAWYVAEDGNDSSTCDRPSAPCATIQPVLSKPGFRAGDTIMIAAGAYPPVQMTKAARLSGGWDRAFTQQNGFSMINGKHNNSINPAFLSGDFPVEIDRFIIRRSMTYGIITPGNLTITNSAIQENLGTGLLITGYSGSPVRLVNTTVTRNYDRGIYVQGKLEIINSTIAENVTNNTGGAGIHAGNATILMRNSIIANNRAKGRSADCSARITSQGYNLIKNPEGCSYTPGPGDLVGVDPKLDLLSSSLLYLPLLPDSPAYNAGDPGGCLDQLGQPLRVDQTGKPRLGRCDIGASEASPLLPSRMTVNQETVGVGNTLTYAIILQHNESVAISNVTATNLLPQALIFVPGSLSASSGNASFSNGVVQWTGQVPAGAGVTITYQASVQSASGPIVNQATVNGAGQSIQLNANFLGTICNFARYPSNPVLDAGPSRSWDRDGVLDPTILKDGTQYKMYYTGLGGNKMQIGLAVSSDGIHWNRATQEPLLDNPYGEYKFRVGTVLKENGVYKMWYTRKDGYLPAYAWLAISTDGVHWSQAGQNPILLPQLFGFGNQGISDVYVMRVSGGYHMWLTAESISTLRIGHAFSSDGLRWTWDEQPAVRRGAIGEWDWVAVGMPNVVQVGDRLDLWYTGVTIPPATQIGFLSSRDGLSWIRSGKPFISRGMASNEVLGVHSPWVQLEGSIYRIWYTGVNANGKPSINYATAGECDLRLDKPVSGSPTGNWQVHLPVILNPARVLVDTFNNPGSGWPIVTSDEVDTKYEQGVYKINVKKTNYDWFSSLGAPAKDMVIEVSASVLKGEAQTYGISFDHFGFATGLEFSVRGNQYSLRRVRPWSDETLIVGWTTSPYINPAPAWNRLKVIRQGNRVDLYINDYYLTTATVDYGSNGYGDMAFGLAAHTLRGSINVQFDNFTFTSLNDHLYEYGVFPPGFYTSFVYPMP